MHCLNYSRARSCMILRISQRSNGPQQLARAEAHAGGPWPDRQEVQHISHLIPRIELETNGCGGRAIQVPELVHVALAVQVIRCAGT